MNPFTVFLNYYLTNESMQYLFQYLIKVCLAKTRTSLKSIEAMREDGLISNLFFQWSTV